MGFRDERGSGAIWGVKTALTRQELGPNRMGKNSCEPASAQENRAIGCRQVIVPAAISNTPSPGRRRLASGVFGCC